jgi:hypothetical protein
LATLTDLPVVVLPMVMLEVDPTLKVPVLLIMFNTVVFVVGVPELIVHEEFDVPALKIPVLEMKALSDNEMEEPPFAVKRAGEVLVIEHEVDNDIAEVVDRNVAPAPEFVMLLVEPLRLTSQYVALNVPVLLNTVLLPETVIVVGTKKNRK